MRRGRGRREERGRRGGAASRAREPRRPAGAGAARSSDLTACFASTPPLPSAPPRPPTPSPPGSGPYGAYGGGFHPGGPGGRRGEEARDPAADAARWEEAFKTARAEVTRIKASGEGPRPERGRSRGIAPPLGRWRRAVVPNGNSKFKHQVPGFGFEFCEFEVQTSNPQEALDKLDRERKAQEARIAAVSARLERERGGWIPRRAAAGKDGAAAAAKDGGGDRAKEKGGGEKTRAGELHAVADGFLRTCVLPRLTMGAGDAVFCFEFAKRLQALETPGWSAVLFYVSGGIVVRGGGGEGVAALSGACRASVGLFCVSVFGGRGLSGGRGLRGRGRGAFLRGGTGRERGGGGAGGVLSTGAPPHLVQARRFLTHAHSPPPGQGADEPGGPHPLLHGAGGNMPGDIPHGAPRGRGPGHVGRRHQACVHPHAH